MWQKSVDEEPRCGVAPAPWELMLYKVSRFAAIGAFTLAPLPFGSVETIWICIWAMLLAFSLSTADLRNATADDSYLLLPIFFTLAVVAAVITIQLWPDAPVPQINSVWASAREATGDNVPGRISMT